MNPLKNQKGMALVTVIIVMVVTMVLGTAVTSLAVSDTKFAENQEQHLQAQYIARAGADAAASYVQDHPGEFVGAFSTRTMADNTPLGEGTFTAVISRPFTGAVLVTSIGTVNGVSEKVTLSLSKGSYSGIFRGIRQTAHQDLELGALEIYYSGSTVDIEGNVEDAETDISLCEHNPDNAMDTNINKEINTESAGVVVIPDYWGYDGTMDADDPSNTIINGNIYIHSLTKENNQSITFNTQGKNQIVVVDSMDLSNPQGDVNIIGGGTVHLYLLGDSSINNPMNANTGDPSELFIYLADGVTLQLQRNCELSAYIYGPNATIQMQADQTTVYGAIVGNIIEREHYPEAHGEFHYVPLPEDTDYSGILYYVRNYYSNR